MSSPHWSQFRPRTWLIGTLVIAAVLLTVVVVPQLLSRDARLQVLREHVGEMARLVASQVDGDLHRALIDGTRSDEATRRQALAPLLRLHSAWPEAFYVYTMGVRDGGAVFILDTAQDPGFARRRGLRASQYLEPFRLRKEYASNWLDELAAGHTYVNDGFQYDDYGYFLTGHAPIRDSAGQVAGFAGVDFDLGYYLRDEAQFRRIGAASIALTVLLSLLLGYMYARYRYSQQMEMRLHYESAMLDSLTGLPNRRGALAAIQVGWSDASVHSHAALLVDIDNFKSINDSSGHVAGDEVIRALARALNACLRPGDIAARLGGDEFLIFARDCDRQVAERMAQQLLAVVRQTTSADISFRISIGISVVTAAQGSFDLLYRQADTALYRAKGAGRDGYTVFAPG